MNKVENTLSHAETQCKKNGARLTTKRKQVLSGLLSSGKALSAYELIDACKAEFGEALPAMSMYRILDFLQQEHLVHKLNIANKYVACSHITCSHEHAVPQFLICENCQSVKEIVIEKSIIDELNKNVGQAGYKLTSQQIEMNCVCDGCLNTAA